jgi:uncharacterized hydrophobic protein (TIGR00341 family)
MALRLVEMVLPEQFVTEARELLHEQKVVDAWYDHLSESHTLIMILVSAEKSEPLIDLLDNRFSQIEGFRLIILPVSASLPRLEEEEAAKPPAQKGTKEEEAQKAARLSREELYTQITDTSKATPAYFALVILSTVVAAIGLINNNVAVVIGAMVIAPLLGPNMALALGTTLGDSALIKNSLKTNISGLLTAVVLALILGWLLEVDPHNPQIAARTQIGYMDLVLGLAAGIAGTLAFTAGAPAALIGVMVAVALMPPLVTVGLMIGSGHHLLALGALWLLLTNIICVNLAAVATFWLQGVRPTTWWEAALARRATIISVASSLLLLAALTLIILVSQRQ